MSEGLVIIPTYNEIENIREIIPAVLDLDAGFHLLIIDDNSPDGTGDIVASFQNVYQGRLHLLRRAGKLGLGTAYITGFRFALANGYQYIFEMDADFSHNPLDLIKLYNACRYQGADLAVGSRYVTGVNVVNWPMSRVLMSYYASAYVRLITGMPLHDATAGFKCYRRQVLASFDLDRIKFIGYAFQIEMKFKTWVMGFNVVEVPIIFTDRTKGNSKMSTGIFKEAALGVLSLKISSLFNKPKRLADVKVEAPLATVNTSQES